LHTQHTEERDPNKKTNLLHKIILRNKEQAGDQIVTQKQENFSGSSTPVEYPPAGNGFAKLTNEKGRESFKFQVEK
jgi:hypothetical protein